MTREELSQYDGQDGRRAYVAVNTTIYDVTDSSHWQGGLHPPDHKAGQDLSTEILSAPHIRAVVERFPVVGQLEESSPESGRPGGGKLFLIIGAIAAIVILAGLALML